MIIFSLFLLGGVTQANFLVDALDSITKWSVTNAMKKAGVYKTIAISSDNTTGNATVCLGCTGQNIISNLVNENGTGYIATDENTIVHTAWENYWYVPSNWGKFIDAAFRGAVPSDLEIAEKLFWANSAYVDLWENNSCSTSGWDYTVIRVYSWTNLQSVTITWNHIYILWQWVHTLTSQKGINISCVAVITTWATISWYVNGWLIDMRTDLTSWFIVDWWIRKNTSSWKYWISINNIWTMTIRNITLNNVETNKVYIRTPWPVVVVSWYFHESWQPVVIVSLTTWYVYNSRIQDGTTHWIIDLWANTVIKYNILSWNATAISSTSWDIDTNIFCNNTSDWNTWTNALLCNDSLWQQPSIFIDQIEFSLLVWFSSGIKIWLLNISCNTTIAGAIQYSWTNFYGCNGTTWVQLDN